MEASREVVPGYRDTAGAGTPSGFEDGLYLSVLGCTLTLVGFGEPVPSCPGLSLLAWGFPLIQASTLSGETRYLSPSSGNCLWRQICPFEIQRAPGQQRHRPSLVPGLCGPLRSGVRHRGPGPSPLWAMSHSRRAPLGPELYVTTGFVSLLGPETNHLGKLMPCSFCSHLGTSSGHHTGRCPNRKRQDPLTPPGTRLPVGCLPGPCHPHFSVQAVGVDTLDGWTGGPGEELQDGTP